ncbi:uncharacterized protein [Salvelinus alpinus]|uniref:uncharacterized protein isoform X2 n=1 Tax=Salvelinus alpinus TaxID=8036 RepID=UPI0039FCBCBD
MRCISALTSRNCSASTKQEKAMGNSYLNHGINGQTGRRFTGSDKLKGIIIAGEDDESHPAEMRLEYTPSSEPAVRTERATIVASLLLHTRTYPTCPLMTHAENLSMSSVSIEIHWLSWNTQIGLPVFPTLITCQFTYHGTLGQSPHGSTTLG